MGVKGLSKTTIHASELQFKQLLQKKKVWFLLGFFSEKKNVKDCDQIPSKKRWTPKKFAFLSIYGCTIQL